MMKSLYNYILLAVMAFATAGCLGELNTDIPSTESGDEVQFGLSLPSMTRTTYGDKNAAGTAYPIYWVDGDKVQVYSPQCLAGRNDAEYKVSVSSATQNYATSLTPTGANGVQWGDQPAMFYSVYPSGKYTISDDGATIQNLKINFSDEFEVTHGEQGNNVVTPKGADCLMFAKTPAPVDPRTQVNLSYSPMATSVIITLQGPSANSAAQKITIQSIKLIAPSGTFIAGNFNVEFDEESNKYVHTGWVDGSEKSNSITAQVYDKSTGAFHVIERGETLPIPIFLAPISGLSIKEGTDETTIDDDWRIEILVQAQITELDANKNEVTKDVIKTFTKKLKFAEGFNANLEPGMVHELPTLPTLDIIADDSSSEWEVGDWMENIPRNVYLSEISIPGAWNSLNSDCQSNTSIAAQYALGVRAFHLDTRWKSSNTPSDGIYGWGATSPEGVELSVAIGGSGNTNSYDGGNLMKSSIPNFASYLKQITDNVQPNEYMIVICTFAQNSYNGDECPSTWYEAISNVCASNDDIFDASNITQNTLVGDVLDKVIVIVNMSEPITSTTSLPKNSKCLFTYVPMNLGSDHYTGTNATIDGHIDPLYYSTKESSGISMYTSHAQISTTGTSAVNLGDRGYSHPLTNRDNLVNAIWDWSKTNYGTSNYKHDHWMYLGLGGYILNNSYSSGSGYNTIENRYGPMIYNRIDEMGKNDVPYYPVGVILMNNKHGGNYTTTSGDNTIDLGYGFSDVCKKILLLNNEYRLQYDPNKPSDYNPNAKTKSAAPSYSSGMNDSNVAAFGWD